MESIEILAVVESVSNEKGIEEGEAPTSLKTSAAKPSGDLILTPLRPATVVILFFEMFWSCSVLFGQAPGPGPGPRAGTVTTATRATCTSGSRTT